MNTEITLPSGAVLKITLAPFAQAKALYQAVLTELCTLNIQLDADVDANFLKDLFCTGLASKKIDSALAECLKRVTYDGQRVTDAIFEPEAARGDYLVVLVEVARCNISPFTKSLSRVLNTSLEAVAGLQKPS